MARFIRAIQFSDKLDRPHKAGDDAEGCKEKARHLAVPGFFTDRGSVFF
jgi:hypothetical protein